MKGILIDNMRIQGCDMLETWWCASPTPIFQSLMFAHAIGRKCDVFPKGVIYIHKNYEINGQHKYGDFIPNNPVGFNNICAKKGESSITSKVHAGATYDLQLSLILVYEDEDILESIDDFKDYVFNSRLSGGQIINCFVKSIPELNSMKNIQDSTKTGFVLFDRKDLLQNKKHRLESMLDILSKREYSWLLPTKIGYKLCEEPTTRKGIRGGYEYLHAFAEPLVGLVQLKSLRSLESNMELPIWEYGYSNNICIVKQN